MRAHQVLACTTVPAERSVRLGSRSVKRVLPQPTIVAVVPGCSSPAPALVPSVIAGARTGADSASSAASPVSTLRLKPS